MMATGTVLLVMTLDIMLITHPTSSSTGIFILTRLDCTVSRRELMLSITPFGKELSMSTSRTFTILWDLSISLRVGVTCSLNRRSWLTFRIWLFSLTIRSVTSYSSKKKLAKGHNHEQHISKVSFSYRFVIFTNGCQFSNDLEYFVQVVASFFASMYICCFPPPPPPPPPSTHRLIDGICYTSDETIKGFLHWLHVFLWSFPHVGVGFLSRTLKFKNMKK